MWHIQLPQIEYLGLFSTSLAGFKCDRKFQRLALPAGEKNVCGWVRVNVWQLIFSRWQLCSLLSACEILSKDKLGYKTYNAFKATLRCIARPKVMNIKMSWEIKTHIIQGALFIIIITAGKLIVIFCNVSTTSASMLVNIPLHYYDVYYQTHK